jgi:hypothetical protein
VLVPRSPATGSSTSSRFSALSALRFCPTPTEVMVCASRTTTSTTTTE